MEPSPLFHEISRLRTELNNHRTTAIDRMSTQGILETINEEDALVALAVREVIPNITIAVDAIVQSFRSGGRLFYVGAGTSGRLGVLDASECPPTFGVSHTMVQGIIAGGDAAMFRAQEGVEDSRELGAKVIEEHGLTSADVLCGIAASGRTPFVRAALESAKNNGIYTILVTTNHPEQVKELGVAVDCLIAPQTGPEVIAGSTRLKSGTAQKMILNMLTTASMIRIGKTLGNVMVDLRLSNDKLVERARKIIMTTCDVNYATASSTLQQAGDSVKVAIVMLKKSCDADHAKRLLDASDGFIYKAVETTQ